MFKSYTSKKLNDVCIVSLSLTCEMFSSLICFPILNELVIVILLLNELLFILLAGYCAYLDVENALDLSLVESIGINTANLLVSHPDCAENLLSMVDTLTKSGAVDVIVIDSVSDSLSLLTSVYHLRVWQSGVASDNAAFILCQDG